MKLSWIPLPTKGLGALSWFYAYILYLHSHLSAAASGGLSPGCPKPTVGAKVHALLLQMGAYIGGSLG